MERVLALVKVTKDGKELERPVMVVRGHDGRLVVEGRTIRAMANEIGFNENVVMMSVRVQPKPEVVEVPDELTEAA